MKKDKREKISFVCFLSASICFFISAVFGFIDGNNMTITKLCLGACFLCLSSVH